MFKQVGMKCKTKVISYSPAWGEEDCVGYSCHLFSMSTKSVLSIKRFCKEGNWFLRRPLLILNIVYY